VAFDIARRIRRAAPLGVSGRMKSWVVARQQGEAAVLACLLPELESVTANEGVKEGLASFLQRRDAFFEGR